MHAKEPIPRSAAKLKSGEFEIADLELARGNSVLEQPHDSQRRRDQSDRAAIAARAATDDGVHLGEQTASAVALLLAGWQEEDQTNAAERTDTDGQLESPRLSSSTAMLPHDEVLALVSHDLHGLLAAQKLLLTLLMRTPGDIGRQTTTLLEINAQMERLVDDLVDVVAIDSGSLRVKAEPCYAFDLVSRACELFEPLARQRGQTLSLVAAASDPMIMADPGRALQVLGNLISNAMKFTPEGGQICVGFESSSRGEVFFVADSGPGIDATRVSSIFDRFVGSRHADGGLGLGLYICKRLVEAHEGRIWLDQNVEQGSLFRFTLARAEP